MENNLSIDLCNRERSYDEAFPYGLLQMKEQNLNKRNEKPKVTIASGSDTNVMHVV